MGYGLLQQGPARAQHQSNERARPEPMPGVGKSWNSRCRSRPNMGKDSRPTLVYNRPTLVHTLASAISIPDT